MTDHLGLVVSVALLLACLLISVRSAVRYVQSRPREGRIGTVETGHSLRSLGLSLVAANWCAYSAMCCVIGGTALIGEIAGEDYLVPLNAGSYPVSCLAGCVALFT